MAIYTTFFICNPQQLVTAFPGWRLPLAKPVKREFWNPLTRQMTTIETREPEWPEDEEAGVMDPGSQAVAIEGNYEDYLEGRLPPFVRANQHWAAKGLTEVELTPLAEAVGVEPKFELPLYAPPSSGAVLQELPPDMLSKLAPLDGQALQVVAGKWAAAMSTPEHTHSVTGVKLNDGWEPSVALEILKIIVALAGQAGAGQRMYLLIEA